MRKKGLILVGSLIAALLSCAPNDSTGRVQKQAEPLPKPTTKVRPETHRQERPELDHLQEAFLSTIKAGNAVQFMDYVSPGGVYLGVDGPKVSRERIQNEIRARSGIYCVLFDSDCLKRESRVAFVCSYRQLLTNPHTIKISTPRYTYDGKQQAEIVLDVLHADCPRTFESFIFRKEASGWKLIAIPYL